jgi:hypothetical protein
MGLTHSKASVDRLKAAKLFKTAAFGESSVTNPRFIFIKTEVKMYVQIQSTQQHSTPGTQRGVLAGLSMTLFQNSRRGLTVMMPFTTTKTLWVVEVHGVCSGLLSDGLFLELG